MKKFFALVLAVMLVMSLAVTASAAPVSLSITGENTGHTYEAYQIFSGNINASGVMTDIVWGSGIKDGAALLAALKTDTTEIVNSIDPTQKTTMAAQFAAANTAEDVANVMKTWGNGAERIDYFADFLYAKKHLTDAPTATTTSTTTTYTFASLEPGYYLIKDKDGTQDDKHDFYTKFIIDLTTSTNITVKGSVPHVEKKVSHMLESGFGEEISNQLNKTHYYQWIGHIPADINEYDFYYYKFTDTMSNGLTFDKFEQIYILHANNEKTMIYDASQADPNVNAGLKPNTMNYVVNSDGTTTIDVEWTDLLAKYPTLLTSDKIYVKYSAHLNTNAVIGLAGNPNEVRLTYSNNPHDQSDHGLTPPDEARVYSFKLKVTKVNPTGQPLTGAEFVLYHFHTENEYDGGGNFIGTKNVEMYAIVGSNHKITGWTKDINSATKLTTGADGIIKAEGLQEEVGYYLRETKAPDGYNKLKVDVKVVIDDSFTVNSTDHKINYFRYEVDGKATELTDSTDIKAEAGEVVTSIENKAGTTLPSTGGMGTTLFYVIGSVLVMGALVMLITKKRMAAEN